MLEKSTKSPAATVIWQDSPRGASASASNPAARASAERTPVGIANKAPVCLCKTMNAKVWLDPVSSWICSGTSRTWTL